MTAASAIIGVVTDPGVSCAVEIIPAVNLEAVMDPSAICGVVTALGASFAVVTDASAILEVVMPPSTTVPLISE